MNPRRERLPPRLEALVSKTVHAARLDPSRSSTVREDLEAHFEDGLAAGKSIDQLVADFGDPARAARLLSQSFRSTSPHAAEPQRTMPKTMTRLIDALRSDCRYAVRNLLRTPGFTLIASLTLALGIGVNTAIFSVVRATLLSSVPLENADRIVIPYFRQTQSNTDRTSVPYADFADWRRERDVFEAMSLYGSAGLDLEGDPPQRVFGTFVTEDFFDIFDASASLGRTFRTEDFVEGAERVVILAKEFWESRFGADPEIVGQSIRLSGNAVTVIGVVDEQRTWPSGTSFWTPRIFPVAANEDMTRRDNFAQQVVAKLRPGVEVEQARARVAALAARIAVEEPTIRKGWEADLMPLTQWIVGPTLPSILTMLLGAATFVLLIACTNVASLLATRTSGRRRQTAIRVALGAGPSSIARHLLAESLLVFAIGGLLGTALAALSVNALVTMAPSGLPTVGTVGVQTTELAFAFLIALIGGLGFGLYPAMVASRADPIVSLRDGTKASDSRAVGRFRKGLVVLEVALSVILLVGAGLMIRTLAAINATHPGIRLDHVITFSVVPPTTRYPTPRDTDLLYRRLLARLATAPGVERAATTTWFPVGGGGIGLTRVHLGTTMPEPPAGPQYVGRWMVVDQDLFETLEWPLTRGRGFDVTDQRDNAPVAILNEVMAQQMFPGTDPIGKRVRSWRDENIYREIVGVVGNIRLDGAADDLQPLFIVPATQVGWARFRNVVLRTNVDPTTLLPQVQSIVSDVDPLLPINFARTGDDVFERSVASNRYVTMLLGIFAGLAIVVASIGLYGLISTNVTNRWKELGIRAALGAGRGRMIRSVVMDGIRLAALGAGIGIGASLFLTGALRSLLFGVDARDPMTLIAIGAGSLAVAAVASLIPARRATRVNPVRVLREE